MLPNFLKISLLSILVLFFANDQLRAQGFKDRSLHSLGYGAFTEFVMHPVAKMEVAESTVDEYVIKEVDQTFNTISVFTLSYNYRYNIAEPSDEFSVGLNINPSIGMDVLFEEYTAVGKASLPGMITADFGAGSTYRSSKDFGFFVGAGMEYNYFPFLILGDEDPLYDETGPMTFDKSWTQTAMALGVRFYGGWGLSEVAFKYAFGPVQEVRNIEGDVIDDKYRSASFRLTYSFFFDY